MRGRWLAVCAVVAGAGCVDAGRYGCRQGSQCIRGGEQGACEPTGFCSFRDLECASGSRYAPGAGGGLGGMCTGSDGGGVNPDGAPPPIDGGGPDARMADSGRPPDDMVAVAAGSFVMGCLSSADPSCESDEQPQHTVMLGAFLIDKYEVTQAQYQACLDSGSCTVRPLRNFDPGGRPQHPVIDVPFAGATSFCAWLGKRLPTEAEWEKASRGSTGQLYPWGNAAITCVLANYDACGFGLQPVGMHPTGASPYGAHDMAGNASEWVSDYFSASYYASSPATSPTGPASGSTHGLRSGNHIYPATWLRCANRYENSPSSPAAADVAGFRCVR